MSKKVIKKIQNSLSPSLLKGRWKTKTQSHPTEGHCYVAAEALYHLYGKYNGYQPCMLSNKLWPEGLDVGETHWFLKDKKGRILDPTKEQFMGEKILYDRAKKCGFLTKNPSYRARKVINRVIYERKEANR